MSKARIQEGGLTTLDPCLVHARVSGGLPVQAQVKAASMPMSTVCGLGSDSSLGPTTDRTRQSSVKKTQKNPHNYNTKRVSLMTTSPVNAHVRIVMPVHR